MFAAATKQKSFSKPRGKSLKSQRATVDAVKTFQEEQGLLCRLLVLVLLLAIITTSCRSHCPCCIYFSVSLSSSCCSQSDKTENVVGPATPIFNVRDLTRKDDVGKKELGSFQSRGIGIGIGYVQLLELPCTYLHWATTVN